MMARPFLLVIEDDDSIALSLRVFFEGKGYDVATAPTGTTGMVFCSREIPDTVILDLRLPDIYGIDVLQAIKSDYPEISVIMMTGYGEVEEAVKAMKLGAEYYFRKPIDLEELAVVVDKSIGIRQIRQEASLYRKPEYPIVGKSSHTQGLIHMVSLLASNSSTTVLIQGETGTGKELVARNIHALSSRSNKPFIDINCAAIPENIVESELFGYEAGAFTDAKKTKKGLFELADGGTLFLDEIGDMPYNAQAKILRVIEQRSLKRLGGARDIGVDVRIIAATNRDLDTLVKEGSFREDLYYRLNVIPLIIPALRQRPEDIPIIAEFLLGEIKKSLAKKNIIGFDEKVTDLLCSYEWPGNVRELRNVIERAAIACDRGEITAEHLTLPKREPAEDNPMTLSEVERVHIRKVLRLTDGNKTRAARILGIARSTLNEKIKYVDL